LEDLKDMSFRFLLLHRHGFVSQETWIAARARLLLFIITYCLRKKEGGFYHLGAFCLSSFSIPFFPFVGISERLSQKQNTTVQREQEFQVSNHLSHFP
jgi:hypothetical protein